jgi:hypothetical protein
MNEDLEQKLQNNLRDSEGDIDAATLRRLREARQRATAAANDHARPPWQSNWIPAAAVASASAIAVFVALSPDPMQPIDNPAVATAPQAQDIPKSVELDAFEASLLMAADVDELLELPANEQGGVAETDELLDLYENLEFYEWLLLEADEEATS